MAINVLAGQFAVSLCIRDNLAHIETILDGAEPDDLVVVPEGALSGYSDNIGFLDGIDPAELQRAMGRLKTEAMLRRVHLIFGSCILESGLWYNAAICYSYTGNDFTYRKINLALHERGHMEAGSILPIHSLRIGDQIVRVGMQLCREIRFPEQWRWLAMRGASIFVYLTNAINTHEIYSVWKSHLVSRAAENQRFLVASNNAHLSQNCPTMLVSPRGEVLEEIHSDRLCSFRRGINLDEASNWYMSQSRHDVVTLTSGNGAKKQDQTDSFRAGPGSRSGVPGSGPA